MNRSEISSSRMNESLAQVDVGNLIYTAVRSEPIVGGAICGNLFVDKRFFSSAPRVSRDVSRKSPKAFGSTVNKVDQVYLLTHFEFKLCIVVATFLVL